MRNLRCRVGVASQRLISHTWPWLVKRTPRTGDSPKRNKGFLLVNPLQGFIISGGGYFRGEVDYSHYTFSFDDLHGSGIRCRIPSNKIAWVYLLGPIGARHSLLLALESDDDEGENLMMDGRWEFSASSSRDLLIPQNGGMTFLSPQMVTFKWVL